ncbi:MAG: hypothetical protein E6R09_11905 [Rhodocyclaceae bacterium]|jgi:hypothetical protein|nr:MAG: hypothetical protein E6R09_11905 [Rhodocyclaceae bacterium]
MNVKIHYRITDERAGRPLAYTGTRHFVVRQGEPVEDTAKNQLASDYQVPISAVEICRIEH